MGSVFFGTPCILVSHPGLHLKMMRAGGHYHYAIIGRLSLFHKNYFGKVRIIAFYIVRFEKYRNRCVCFIELQLSECFYAIYVPHADITKFKVYCEFYNTYLSINTTVQTNFTFVTNFTYGPNNETTPATRILSRTSGRT